MGKNLKTKLLSRKIKKPDPLLMSIGFCVLGLLNKKYKVQFHYDYDPRSIRKQPAILLSSHASRLEFIYSLYGFQRKDINTVCGYQNILKKGLYFLFLRLGVISKYLYQPDPNCVKNILRVLKRNGAIGLFPEGIQSTSGSTHPINPATTKFLKKSKANIVVCTTKGAYLATNRYSGDRKKGHIQAEYSLLFTPEKLEALTEEEIYRQLLEKISYNDFAYNQTAGNTYVGKKPNAFGIDRILYKCPACKGEGVLRVEQDTILCGGCGFRARVNDCYDLLDPDGSPYPFHIDQWYKWQRRQVRQEVEDDSFVLRMTGSICTLKLDKLRKSPDNQAVLSVGTAELTNRGLTFTGALDGQKVDFDFPAISVYSLTLSSEGFLEFYQNGEYYMIVPDNKEQDLIKWTLAAEEIHNRYDNRWRAACADVYEYEKGDIYG